MLKIFKRLTAYSREHYDGESLDWSRRNHQIVGLLMSIAFIVFSVILFYILTISPMKQVSRAHNWIQTPCEVRYMGLSFDDSPELILRYTYEIDGKKYFSSGYKAGHSRKNDLLCSAGMKTFCYVNPNDQTEAVMFKDGRIWTPWVLIPIAMFILGIFILKKAIGYIRAGAQKTTPKELYGSKKEIVKGMMGGLLFLTVISIIAFSMLNIMYFEPSRQIENTKDWVQTPCLIKQMHFPLNSSSMNITYQYKFNNKFFQSNVYSLPDLEPEKGQIFASDQIASCFVNPNNPSEAMFIKPQIPTQDWSGFIIIMGTVWGVGLGLFIYFLYQLLCYR